MADQNIENACHKLADDTQIYALKAFNIKLDYTNKSIKKLELILSKMHISALHNKPNKDQIIEFAKGCGSYLGKVYIRNYGGQWGMAGSNEESYPGIRCDNNEFYFWPWIKVFNRISDWI